MSFDFTNKPQPQVWGSFYTELEGYLDGLLNDVLEEATPVNGVASQGTLTVSGVVIDGETCTVGTDIYEFCTDVAQSVTAGNVAVDITGGATASAGLLTVAVQPISGDTMTIGTKVFTFVTNDTANADGEISVGDDLAEAKTNIVDAINGDDGWNVASTFVTAGDFTVNDCVITALVAGTSGDLIDSTETFDNVGNIFDATTLGTEVAGVDCIAGTAITALVGADVGTTYSLADGAGDTVVATASAGGEAGDLIASTETMANGVWDATTLGTTTAGVDATVGAKGAIKFDSTNVYVCTALTAITTTTATWKKLTLLSL